MGSWALKLFCVLHFLFIRNSLQPPWSSLSSREQVQRVANQGRERIQRQERNSLETTSQLWDRVLSTPQGIHIKTSLSSSAKLKFPPKYVNYFRKHSSFQTEGHSLTTLRTTEAHQDITWGQIKRLQTLHTSYPYQQPHPWTSAIKLLTKSCAGKQFWEHEPTVFHFTWQNNKVILFYFTQNSISESWFSTGT